MILKGVNQMLSKTCAREEPLPSTITLDHTILDKVRSVRLIDEMESVSKQPAATEKVDSHPFTLSDGAAKERCGQTSALL